MGSKEARNQRWLCRDRRFPSNWDELRGVPVGYWVHPRLADQAAPPRRLKSKNGPANAIGSAAGPLFPNLSFLKIHLWPGPGKFRWLAMWLYICTWALPSAMVFWCFLGGRVRYQVTTRRRATFCFCAMCVIALGSISVVLFSDGPRE